MSDLDDLYREVILDHSRRPRGAGLRDPFSAEVYQVNPTCGDEVTLRVRLDGTGPRTVLADVSYESQGCAISMASTSVMAQWVTGAELPEVLEAYRAFQRLVARRPVSAQAVSAQADAAQADAAEADAGAADPRDLVELGDDDAAAFAGVAKYPARVRCAMLGWTALQQALLRGQPDQSGAVAATA